MTQSNVAAIRRVLTIVFSLGLFAAGTAAAQEAASIVGRVTDESGGVMPGVTVTAKSPSLQLQQVSTISGAEGEYRLTPLPVGVYTVEYELAGFQGVRREEIRLTVGFTAKVDVVLKIGSLQETVTVSSQSPLVDVTSTTATTQFTQEQLAVLPTSRNGLLSLMAQATGGRRTPERGGG